jgi:multimeric flavodoxin WrbA
MSNKRAMKVFGISGSPRKKGNTEFLIQLALDEIRKEGIDTEIITLADKTISPCNACMACQKDKNRCLIDDDFGPIFLKIREADGLILGTPVYFGSATPNIKSFMDRAGYVCRQGENFFYRKVGAPIVVARRAGQNFTLAQLTFFFLLMGMIVIPGSPYWTFGFGRDIGEVEKDLEAIETISNLGRNIAWLLKKINS